MNDDKVRGHEVEGNADSARPMMPILKRMVDLEEGIRELHDKLTLVLSENQKAEDSEAKKPPVVYSPMLQRLILMNEIIDDINQRLEL